MFALAVGSVAMCAADSSVNVAADSISLPAPADVADIPAPPAKKVWTFSDCVDWASVNSTDVRRTLLDILQADQDVASAKDAYLPTVGFSTSHSFTNYPSPASGQKGNAYGSNYGISANWTAWEGNVRKYRLEASRLLLRQQYLAQEEAVKSLKLSILQTYINIMYAKEAVEIAEKNLEVSDSETERAKRLMESGRTSKVDYAQIESQNAQDAYSLVEARNNLESARLTLKNILQLGLGYDIDVTEAAFSDTDVLRSLPSPESVFAAASAWLPKFRSNELSRDIYSADVKAAKAGYLPTVSLQGGLNTGYSTGGAGWGSQMGHNFNENVGVTLSVPIFDGNQTKRAVAKARLAELDYDITLKSLQDDLTQTLEGLYIDSSNAQAKYIAGKSRLEAALLTRDLTARQFELGLVNPLELLTARNNYINAQLELLQNKYMAILAAKTLDYYATREISL